MRAHFSAPAQSLLSYLKPAATLLPARLLRSVAMLGREAECAHCYPRSNVVGLRLVERSSQSHRASRVGLHASSGFRFGQRRI